jgi:hypothetical protein
MRSNDFAPLERQETSILATERPILAQLGQNSVHRIGEARADVTRALCSALERWTTGGTAREARVLLVVCSRCWKGSKPDGWQMSVHKSILRS